MIELTVTVFVVGIIGGVAVWEWIAEKRRKRKQIGIYGPDNRSSI